MVKCKVKREILDFLKKLKEKINVQEFILFGSVVRGEEMEESDYDFIIVSEDFKGKGFTDRIREVYEFWKYKRGIDVLCYTPEEFKKKKREISIVREALKEGIRFL